MNRSLKPSLRPFIVFGIIFGLLSLFSVYTYFQKGHHFYQIEPAFMFVGLYILLMVLLNSVRVSVSDVSVIVRRWYIMKTFVPFDEIDHSDIQYLGERDWPIMLTIYGKNRVGILVRIGLKTIQKEDAEWLCALSEIKGRRHPGLTKKL